MGTFKYCTRCGKLFNSMGSAICPKCTVKEDEEYKIVKEYIYDNEGANIVEVSKGTGVPVESILRFLKEERLMMTIMEGSIMLVCESCGAPIQTGRYCSDCKSGLVEDLNLVLDSAKRSTTVKEALNREGHGMFTAGHRKQAD